MAVPAILALVGHQQVHGLRQPEHTEHRREAVDGDQTFGGQPVRVEEVLLFDQRPDACFGQFSGELDKVGQCRCEKRLDSARVAHGHFLQIQTDERVCPAADLQ